MNLIKTCHLLNVLRWKTLLPSFHFFMIMYICGERDSTRQTSDEKPSVKQDMPAVRSWHRINLFACKLLDGECLDQNNQANEDTWGLCSVRNLPVLPPTDHICNYLQ